MSGLRTFAVCWKVAVHVILEVENGRVDITAGALAVAFIHFAVRNEATLFLDESRLWPHRENDGRVQLQQPPPSLWEARHSLVHCPAQLSTIPI